MPKIGSRTFFYITLASIPALSIFGREVQSLVSVNDLTNSVKIGISFALIGIAIILVRREGKIDWTSIALATAVFVALPMLLERYEERVHFILFGVLGIASYKNFGLSKALSVTCLIGISDELIQHWLSFRVGDWRDALMNCLAAFSAVALIHRSKSP